MRKIYYILLALATSAICPFVSAQDNHYAWMQYGSRNAILFNAGISRFEDQSAVIQNPATLAEALSSSFNFNTNMVGFNSIKFKDGLGKGFNITNSNLNVLPSMASGVFKPKDKKMTLGYALYHANTDKLNFSDRSESRRNLINETESPGDENYLAQYTLDNSLDEFTAVAGAGWKHSDRLSFGVSLNFLYRSMESREAFAAYVIADPNSVATVDLVGVNTDYYVKYSNLMTYLKAGFTYRGEGWDLGMVVTSPTFRILGTGKILADFALTNYRLASSPAVPRQNFLANGQIEKVKANYKYPLNVSVGASRQMGKLRMYASAAWYSSLSNYIVMDPGNASFIQPATPDNVFYTSQILNVWSSNRSVINGSIAADWALKDGNHLLMSFRNDQHYAEFDEKQKGNNLAKKIWNNWHFTIGNQRQFKNSALVIGLRFNYGKNNEFPQPVSFEDPGENNLLQGSRGKGVVTSIGTQLLLSYSFTLGNK